MSYVQEESVLHIQILKMYVTFAAAKAIFHGFIECAVNMNIFTIQCVHVVPAHVHVYLLLYIVHVHVVQWGLKGQP